MKREKQLRVRDSCLREATPGMRLVVKIATFWVAKRCWTPIEKIFWWRGLREPLSPEREQAKEGGKALDESGGEKLGGSKYGDAALGDV
jgi:hypothetical protein